LVQFCTNALVLAATGGHLNVVKYLVEAGADIHAREAVQQIFSSFSVVVSLTTIRLLVVQYGATALLSAAENGFHRVAGTALRSSLIWPTVIHGALLFLLEYLLQCGCSPNVVDAGGLTPLMRCAFKNHYKSLQVLTRWGADPTVATKSGKTVWDFAKTPGVRTAIEEGRIGTDRRAVSWG
jgi:hypothetical protein